MNIRYATHQDMESLLPLLNELGYPTTFDQLKIRYSNYIQDSRYGLVVYEDNAIIAGFIAWSKSNLFVSNAVRFHIEALVVVSHCRGKTIGKKLMEFVEQEAKKNAPSIIDLTSGLRRKKDGAHEFYKKLGYHNDGHMAKLYLRKNIDLINP